jgi:hypothetical protein
LTTISCFFLGESKDSLRGQQRKTSAGVEVARLSAIAEGSLKTLAKILITKEQIVFKYLLRDESIARRTKYCSTTDVLLVARLIITIMHGLQRLTKPFEQRQ